MLFQNMHLANPVTVTMDPVRDKELGEGTLMRKRVGKSVAIYLRSLDPQW